MAFDIWGNNLRPGHCEVHPHVHEEYPCSMCLSEGQNREQERHAHDRAMKAQETEYYLGQAQAEIERLKADLKASNELLVAMLHSLKSGASTAEVLEAVRGGLGILPKEGN